MKLKVLSIDQVCCNGIVISPNGRGIFGCDSKDNVHDDNLVQQDETKKHLSQDLAEIENSRLFRFTTKVTIGNHGSFSADDLIEIARAVGKFPALEEFGCYNQFIQGGQNNGNDEPVFPARALVELFQNAHGLKVLKLQAAVDGTKDDFMEWANAITMDTSCHQLEHFECKQESMWKNGPLENSYRLKKSKWDPVVRSTVAHNNFKTPTTLIILDPRLRKDMLTGATSQLILGNQTKFTTLELDFALLFTTGAVLVAYAVALAKRCHTYLPNLTAIDFVAEAQPSDFVWNLMKEASIDLLLFRLRKKNYAPAPPAATLVLGGELAAIVNSSRIMWIVFARVNSPDAPQTRESIVSSSRVPRRQFILTTFTNEKQQHFSDGCRLYDLWDFDPGTAIIEKWFRTLSFIGTNCVEIRQRIPQYDWTDLYDFIRNHPVEFATMMLETKNTQNQKNDSMIELLQSRVASQLATIKSQADTIKLLKAELDRLQK